MVSWDRTDWKNTLPSSQAPPLPGESTGLIGYFVHMVCDEAWTNTRTSKNELLTTRVDMRDITVGTKWGHLWRENVGQDKRWERSQVKSSRIELRKERNGNPSAPTRYINPLTETTAPTDSRRTYNNRDTITSQMATAESGLRKHILTYRSAGGLLLNAVSSGIKSEDVGSEDPIQALLTESKSSYGIGRIFPQSIGTDTLRLQDWLHQNSLHTLPHPSARSPAPPPLVREGHRRSAARR